MNILLTSVVNTYFSLFFTIYTLIHPTLHVNQSVNICRGFPDPLQHHFRVTNLPDKKSAAALTHSAEQHPKRMALFFNADKTTVICKNKTPKTPLKGQESKTALETFQVFKYVFHNNYIKTTYLKHTVVVKKIKLKLP